MVEVLKITSNQQEIGLTFSFPGGSVWIFLFTGIFIISGLLFTMGALSKAFFFDKLFS